MTLVMRGPRHCHLTAKWALSFIVYRIVLTGCKVIERSTFKLKFVVVIICSEGTNAQTLRGNTAAAAEVFLGRRQVSQADTISRHGGEEEEGHAFTTDDPCDRVRLAY